MTLVSVCDRFDDVRKTTPLYDLVQMRLGRDLYAYLSEAQAADRDWRSIAADVSSASGVSVSYESLRRWYEKKSNDAEPAA